MSRRFLRTDGIQRVARNEIDATARHRGRGHHRLRNPLRGNPGFAERQLDFAQNFAMVRMRAHDVELATLAADVDLAIAEHRRRFLHGADGLLPKLVARFDVEGEKIPVVIGLVNAVAIDHRRREAAQESGHRPLDDILAELAFASGVESQDHAHFVAVQVFVAVGGDGVFAIQHDTRVEPALGNHQVEDRLAGLRLHSHHGAVGSASQQQTHPVDHREIHRAVTGIVWTPARCADPYDLAGALVQRDKALRAVGLRAPGGCGRADDHQVAVDRRRNRPPAVRGEGRKLFGDGALPQLLAVFGERGDQVVDAEAVNVAGFGVGDGRGPAHAMRGHVALIQRELVLPEQLAGVGVEAHEAFLLGFARAGRVFKV